MATKKITELPDATLPLAGTELAEIVQGGVNKKVATSEFGGGGGVQSVTGDIVDNTDPLNPIIEVPNIQQVLDISPRTFTKTEGDLTYTFNAFDGGFFEVIIVNNVTNITTIFSSEDEYINLSSLDLDAYGSTFAINKVTGLGLVYQNEFGNNYLKVIPRTSGSALDIANFTPPNDMPNGDYILGLQSRIVNANTTAINDEPLTVIANSTITDPTGVNGKGYIVYVRTGTATIGGVGYGVGSLVYRFYDGSWNSKDFGASSGVAWGAITGTLSAQTDLQTALDLKANKNRYVFQGKTSITGVTGEQDICSFKIPGGAYGSNDGFHFVVVPQKSTTASTSTYKAYIGTTANARTNQICQSAISATNRGGDFMRYYVIDSGNLDTSVSFTANAQSPYSGISTVNTPIAIVPANDIWITITANPTVSGEVHGILLASITPLK